jgi:large subunit ribosomal protein L10
MVSEKNKKMLKDVKAQMDKYSIVGIVDMHKLPGKQLHQIRNKLRGEVVIRMVRKRVLQFCLEQSKLPNAKELVNSIQGEPALVMTNMNPFKLARMIEQYKSAAKAKEGDIAPFEIMIKEGPTPLPPGPAIGDFQKLKIPAMVQGDKIAVRKDTVVAKPGDIISKDLAGMLSKLGIEPMEVKLNLVAALEGGTVYGSDVMFVPMEQYISDVKSAASSAFNLAVYVNYFTGETMPFIIGKASREARAVAKAANIVTADNIGEILAKATAEADAVGKLVKPASEAGGAAPSSS